MEKKLEITSLLDAAYDYLSSDRSSEDQPADSVYSGYNFASFDSLFEACAKKSGLEDTAENRDAFLTALAADGRFVKSSKNEWDINRRVYSMADVAYFYLKEIKAKSPKGADMSIDFQSLFDEVTRRLDISAIDALKKKGSFYTNLTLDGRFIILENYKWDLRENHKFEDCPDINAFYDVSEDEERANLDIEEYEDDDEKEDLGLKKSSDDDSDSSESDRDND